MPYCPKCKYEFIEGIKECPDCGTDLIEYIPQEHEVNIKWVPLTTLKSLVLAEMVREALANNDIPSFIRSDAIQGALLAYSTGIAGTYSKIFVPEEMKDKAQKIQDEISGE
jgi:predicted  nucleic acid-binding Zn-ribbon protein